MLKLINDLTPFFEDNYKRINVREYARIQKISAPTASKLLEFFYKEGILKREEERNYIFYFANKESSVFRDILRIYWKTKLTNSGLIKMLQHELISPVIILFGSLSKGEAKPDSDIDLAVFSSTKKELNLEKFEKLLKRKVQIFMFKNIEDVKNKPLLKNILNGCKMEGNW